MNSSFSATTSTAAPILGSAWIASWSSSGTRSFEASQLVDNFGALIAAIEKAKPATTKGTYMKSIALSTTMGPGLRIEPSSALALRAD